MQNFVEKLQNYFCVKKVPETTPKTEIPNKFAQTMLKKFEYLMSWYGKKYCPIDLYDGSFLDQPSKWRNVKNSKYDADFDWRREATAIFVNNYAFSESLNLKVNRIF